MVAHKDVVATIKTEVGAVFNYITMALDDNGRAERYPTWGGDSVVERWHSTVGTWMTGCDIGSYDCCYDVCYHKSARSGG